MRLFTFRALDDLADVLGPHLHRKELRHADIDVLLPIKQQIASGVALDDEVAEFVAQRHGRILSAFTLLKSDFFRYLSSHAHSRLVQSPDALVRCAAGCRK